MIHQSLQLTPLPLVVMHPLPVLPDQLMHPTDAILNLIVSIPRSIRSRSPACHPKSQSRHQEIPLLRGPAIEKLRSPALCYFRPRQQRTPVPEPSSSLSCTVSSSIPLTLKTTIGFHSIFNVYTRTWSDAGDLCKTRLEYQFI